MLDDILELIFEFLAEIFGDVIETFIKKTVCAVLPKRLRKKLDEGSKALNTIVIIIGIIFILAILVLVGYLLNLL